jgi:hypothetical protein
MTPDLEENLMAAMRQEVGGITAPADILGQATRNHRRRVTVVRGMSALGVLGLAGVLAAGVALRGGTTGDDAPNGRTDNPPAAAVAAPNLRLASAVNASTNLSYTFRFTFHMAARPGATLTDEEKSRLQGAGGPSVDVTGAFDPATVSGFVLGNPKEQAVPEQRLINGTLYRRKVGKWGLVEGKATGMELGLFDRSLGTTADPLALLKVLRDKGTVTDAGNNTYRFTVNQKSDSDGRNVPDTVYTGEVVVGADGRVSKLTFERTNVFDGPKPWVGGLLDVRTIVLGDYGAPVKVEKPELG